MSGFSYIYYGQYTGFSLMSRYIQLFTWSKRSHTAAFYPPDQDGNFSEVIEAWRNGVVRAHWTENHKPGTIIDVYRVPCESAQAEGFYASMEAKIGAKYDFLGVLAFRLRLNIQQQGRWFCSESVFDSALRNGIVLLDDIPAWKVHPGLLDLVPTKQWCKRLVVKKKKEKTA